MKSRKQIRRHYRNMKALAKVREMKSSLYANQRRVFEQCPISCIDQQPNRTSKKNMKRSEEHQLLLDRARKAIGFVKKDSRMVATNISTDLDLTSKSYTFIVSCKTHPAYKSRFCESKLLAKNFKCGICTSIEKKTTKKKAYYKQVWKITESNYKTFRDTIDPDKLRSVEFHLDHIYSISEGFQNNVPASLIGSPSNLRILRSTLNTSKSSRCDQSLDALVEAHQAWVSDRLLKSGTVTASPCIKEFLSSGSITRPRDDFSETGDEFHSMIVLPSTMRLECMIVGYFMEDHGLVDPFPVVDPVTNPVAHTTHTREEFVILPDDSHTWLGETPVLAGITHHRTARSNPQGTGEEWI